MRPSKLLLCSRVNFSINMTYTIFFLNFFMRLDPILTAVNADTLASRIDKKKSSPEKCIFFLPIRFHFTLILKPQRPNACPILLLPRNSCMNTICFFFNFRLDFVVGLKIKFDVATEMFKKS